MNMMLKAVEVVLFSSWDENVKRLQQQRLGEEFLSNVNQPFCLPWNIDLFALVYLMEMKMIFILIFTTLVFWSCRIHGWVEPQRIISTLSSQLRLLQSIFSQLLRRFALHIFISFSFFINSLFLLWVLRPTFLCFLFRRQCFAVIKAARLKNADLHLSTSWLESRHERSQFCGVFSFMILLRNFLTWSLFFLWLRLVGELRFPLALTKRFGDFYQAEEERKNGVQEIV